MPSPAMSLTELDDGKAVEVRLGDSLELRLHENASTGYRWEFDALDETKLQVSDAAFTAGRGVGSGGEVRWNLRPLAAGSVEARLKLWRRWEGERSIQKRFAVTLVARA
jgi:predicted secreted protein